MSWSDTFAHRHRIGISRRELLQVGYSGLLGVGLSSVLARQTYAARAHPIEVRASQRPKSIVLVFLTGAASHHDTFDMKPDAPTEIRGEFKPIATSLPGVQICEHLPRLAARAHKYALVRALSHGDNNHLMSTHHVLTGTKQPGGFFDKVASRDDWPSYAAEERRHSQWRQPADVSHGGAAEVHDRFNRPVRLNRGQVIAPLFSGAAV